MAPTHRADSGGHTYTYNVFMFDPITLAVGAGIAGVGWAIGRYGHRAAFGKTKSAAQCGCGHDLSVHDPNGECHTELRRSVAPSVWEWVQCPCRRYTGPLPVEDYFSRPFLPPKE
ncbi:hypothetical protein CEQ30_40230 [Nocardia brasiliensis]|nr:hypothetical protein CEQ30_40230 [Nocardia brasiliensis]SUB53555.1 Uncharacterised protein [Nocardia brasiliensis]